MWHVQVWHVQVWQYHIISYRIVSYRIVSYLIVSYRIVSYRIVSYRIVSYRIVSYRIVSYRIVSYRIMSYHIVSYRFIACRIISYHIISYHVQRGVGPICMNLPESQTERCSSQTQTRSPRSGRHTCGEEWGLPVVTGFLLNRPNTMPVVRSDMPLVGSPVSPGGDRGTGLAVTRHDGLFERAKRCGFGDDVLGGRGSRIQDGWAGDRGDMGDLGDTGLRADGSVWHRAGGVSSNSTGSSHRELRLLRESSADSVVGRCSRCTDGSPPSQSARDPPPGLSSPFLTSISSLQSRSGSSAASEDTVRHNENGRGHSLLRCGRCTWAPVRTRTPNTSEANASCTPKPKLRRTRRPNRHTQRPNRRPAAPNSDAQR